MGDLRNDMMLLLFPSTHPWTICAGNFGLVNVSRDIPGPVGLGDSGPASIAIPGKPVSASSEDQSVLVGASLDQLLWVTLEWLAQSESLKYILPEAVPAGITGCSEHSNR